MININLKKKTILITGVAGFIGSSLAIKLLKNILPITIVGIDNLDDYYDVSLKEYRLKQIQSSTDVHPGSSWLFIKGGISDKKLMEFVF